MNTTSTLDSRAVAAILTIRGYDGSKLSRSESREQEENHNAAAGTRRVTLRLVPKAYFRDLTEAKSAARSCLYNKTVTFDAGMQLLPLKILIDFEREISRHVNAYNAAADVFATAYQANFDQWLLDLGNGSNAASWPQPETIRSRFIADFSIRPVGDMGNWLTDIGEEDRERLIAQARENERKMLENSVKSCLTKLADRVSHISDRMAEIKANKGKGRIFDSLIGNIADLVDVLPALNFTDDPFLDQAIQLCRERLCGIDTEALKRSEPARDAAQATADDILAAMSAYTG